MRFCISYDVFRGNALENEDYMVDEVLFLRHQSIDVGDRDHDRGWMMVPALEQVVWLQRHYAKITRYVHITSTAAIIEPDDLASDALEVDALLRRVRFVWETLKLEDRGRVVLRHVDGDARLAGDIAALLAYTTGIEAYLLPASRGNEWEAADRSYRGALVECGAAAEHSQLVVAPADLPTDAGGLRRLIESLRGDPCRRVTLRYDHGDYDLAHTVATWLAEATDARVLPEPT